MASEDGDVDTDLTTLPDPPAVMTREGNEGRGGRNENLTVWDERNNSQFTPPDTTRRSS